VQERLNTLLDKQDGGQPLTDSERHDRRTPESRRPPVAAPTPR
jgi:hypothetical protein